MRRHSRAAQGFWRRHLCRARCAPIPTAPAAAAAELPGPALRRFGTGRRLYGDEGNAEHEEVHEEETKHGRLRRTCRRTARSPRHVAAGTGSGVRGGEDGAEPWKGKTGRNGRRENRRKEARGQEVAERTGGCGREPEEGSAWTGGIGEFLRLRGR